MKIAALVSQHVAEVVHGNWTDIYLDDVIADISFGEAVALPYGITNSVAMLLYHLKFYNGVVSERLRGGDPFINEANGLGIALGSETEWQQLKEEAIESFKRLAAAVAEFPDEKLWEKTPSGNDTFYKTLHGVSEHAHYHLGQIVLLKKLIRHSV